MRLPQIALLEKEMDRKDFLKHVGIGAMLLLGGNMVMGALTNLERVSTGSTKSKSLGASLSSGAQGYGNMRYGN